MMKYYSDRTKKFYDTAAECEQAEFKAKEEENRQKILAERKAAEDKARKEKEAADRKAMAAEVENARQNLRDAQVTYRKALEAFCSKYGAYHQSVRDSDIPSLFDSLFDLFN